MDYLQQSRSGKTFLVRFAVCLAVKHVKHHLEDGHRMPYHGTIGTLVKTRVRLLGIHQMISFAIHFLC